MDGGRCDHEQQRSLKGSDEPEAFVTTLLFAAALVYLTLLVHIWIDPQMKAANIDMAYGG